MVNEHVYTYNGSVENGSKWHGRGNVLEPGVPISRAESLIVDVLEGDDSFTTYGNKIAVVGKC
jgi:hypothetical protein